MLSMHLLGLVERRDIWSVRDLQKKHIVWLRHMREKFLDAAVRLYPGVEKDQLKLYMHCEC
jgi:m7GpppX diphosphatase